ncbi:MAG: MFS transporter [bacterium]|nr:MFS transporter [bacterium]
MHSTSLSQEQQLRSNIRKIYVYRVLLGLIFPIPTIVLFWQNHGMSLTDVMLLQALFALAMVVFEVPSGYLADIAGRRKTFILAGISNSLAIAIYSQSQHFYHFLLAEICFAFGFSMISGADAALVYDSLLAIGEEERYQEIYGKLYFYNLFAIGGSSIVGGFIGAINYRWTFYASFPCFLAAIVVALSMVEPPRKKQLAQEGYLRELWRILQYCFVTRPRLRWLIIYSGIVLGLNNAALWFYQPYFKLCGLPVAYFGVAFASYQVFAAVTSKYAYALEKRLGPSYSTIALTVTIGAGYFFMGYFVFLFSFLFAFFHQFARGFSRIVITDYVNQLTESTIRATVLSAQNLVMRLMYALLIPLAGNIADLTSIVQALQILGITTVLAGGTLLLILRQKKLL